MINDMANGTVIYDNGRIYYEVVGSGEPIVFVHGFTLDQTMWQSQIEYMGWVRNKLGGSSTEVRGYIIVGERDSKLNYALQEIGDKVQAMIYKISFKLTKY